uniref:ubiquitin-like-conjugating enzyme ATG10 isoform X4 n=1 Tax=Jaculus jaculus TaxID=51337 RepID=UPI001E1B5D0C|nr:ubiquitin-like-conjugating enzyme ATG10 isoform X4 [Jaculus jaculus]
MDCADGYMCKTHFQVKTATVASQLGKSTSVQTCLPMEEACDLPWDDWEAGAAAAEAEVVKYEYHVLYSCSHQAPVLYFRASFSDGRPLALKDVWEGVHECYRARLLQGPWDTITQQNQLRMCDQQIQGHLWSRCFGRSWAARSLKSMGTGGLPPWHQQCPPLEPVFRALLGSALPEEHGHRWASALAPAVSTFGAGVSGAPGQRAP